MAAATAAAVVCAATAVSAVVGAAVLETWLAGLPGGSVLETLPWARHQWVPLLLRKPEVTKCCSINYPHHIQRLSDYLTINQQQADVIYDTG